MNNITNKWEELLYGFFNHPELGIETDISVEWDEQKGEPFEWYGGFIVPDQVTFQYLEDTLSEWKLPNDIDIAREFEKEVSDKISGINDQTEKLYYLYHLDFKFKEAFDRIPNYRKILGKAIDRCLEESSIENTKRMRRIQYFSVTLERVNQVVQKAIIANTKTLDEVNRIINKSVRPSVKKLKWLCSDSIAGYIITELIDKGYIEAPITDGERSFAKTAEVCSDLFEFTTTSEEYLEFVLNPGRNRLSEIKKQKLLLPDAEQVK